MMLLYEKRVFDNLPIGYWLFWKLKGNLFALYILFQEPTRT
jgi:hypothetical protein